MSTAVTRGDREVDGLKSGRSARPEPNPGQPGSPGPLVAVCALCGGAGASTLAHLLGRAATDRWGRPILLCDAGGPTGGLSLYARMEAPHSLAGVANRLALNDAPSDGLFADLRAGLRLLAGGPDVEEGASPDGLARLLGDAREAHALTVVDCGTLRGKAERQVLEASSHVAWILPATLSGVRRSRRTVELFPRDPARHEVLIARRDGDARNPPMAELSGLAALRGAGLVLMPHVPDLGESDPEPALAQAQLALEAILTVLRR